MISHKTEGNLAVGMCHRGMYAVINSKRLAPEKESTSNGEKMDCAQPSPSTSTMPNASAPPMPPPLPPATPAPAVPAVNVDDEIQPAPAVVPPLHQRAQSAPRVSKFTFTEESKLVLVQCVAEYEGHLAGHGHLDEVFAKVRVMFVENLPRELWQRVSQPSVKTLRDKFRALMRARRNVDAEYAAASGISEDITETDQFLDDMIKEKDAEEEDKKVKRDEATAKEKELAQTGFDLRGEASCRTTKETAEQKNARQDKRRNSRKRKLGDMCDDETEWKDVLRQRIEARDEQDRLANVLKQQELDLQRDRFEEDKRDREAARAQNAKQLELMAMMAKHFK